MSQPDFWDNQETAHKTIGEVNRLKSSISGLLDFRKRLDDVEAMAELLAESGEEDDSPDAKELESTVIAMHEEMDGLEIQSFLTGPHDHANAIVTVHAGAGGTESCDWADMLLRMYTRWAENRGFEVEVQDLQEGDEAGISRATFLVKGENAYGFTRAERGVHRLVRISPFDSNKRRHTSFSSVDVIAEIEDDLVDFEIDEEDMIALKGGGFCV